MNEKKTRLMLLMFVAMFLICIVTIKAQTFPLNQTSAPSPEFYQGLEASPYLYPTYESNPWMQTQWQQDYCNKTGMDFLVMIEPTACSPAVVRSDLLEEEDVPVLCRMTAIKINPLIQVPYIKSIVPVIENKSNEIGFVNFIPARVALSYAAPPEKKKAGFEGVPTMNNLGYLWLQLKQQPVEAKIPDKVKANMSVKIKYDVARTYGIVENQFVLPLLNENEWQQRHKEFGFWRGKGYLRLQEITGANNAKIAVYTSPKSNPIKIVELREGAEPKEEIMLPGFYCGAGVRLKLDKITTPTTRARLLVNGNELLLENGDYIGDSGCKVDFISSSASYGGSVTIWCPTESKVLTIKDYEAKIQVDQKVVKSTVETDLNFSFKTKETEKTGHVYVGFIGKEYSKDGFTDFVLLFSKGAEYEEIKKTDAKRIISKIHDYIKRERGHTLDIALMSETRWINELKTFMKDEPYVKNLNLTVIKPGISIEIKGHKFSLLSASGPEQVYYTKDIEEKYKEAIQQWRDVAYSYANQPSPQGSYYGVIALRNAANLAKDMHKRIDEAELLRELINKYASSEEPEIVSEVENAREELRRAVSGGGDRIVSVMTPQGSYSIELIAIEKPGLGTKEARVEINDSAAVLTVDETVDGWDVIEITENSIKFRNISNIDETISVGSYKYLGSTKIKLLGTILKREVKVTILPFEKERETITNFSVQIGIEKRAIKLTPEKTSELIDKLNKQIATLEKVRDSLGKIVSVWKNACFVSAGALWIKNFVTGLSGEAYARKIVMKSWTKACADVTFRRNIEAKSISDCYRIKEKEINEDIALVKEAVNNANKFVKEIKSVEGVQVRGGLFGLSQTINDNKFMEIAQRNFPSELKNINIYEYKELRRITKSDGAIEFRGQIFNNIDELYAKYKEVDKSEIAKVVGRNVTSGEIISRIDALYKNNRLFKEDIKELAVDLELYKKCEGKQSVLCQDIVKGSFGKAIEMATFVKEIDEISEFYKDFGFNKVIVRPKGTQVLKAFVRTADESFISKISFTGYEKINVGERYTVFSVLGVDYVAVLDPAGSGKLTVKRLYEIYKSNDLWYVRNFYNITTAVPLATKLTELQISEIQEVDVSLCNNNEIKAPYRNEIKFWEAGPYNGFVALMPIDINAGWYMATMSYSGLEGAMIAWKENADINTFWICNVGPDGIPNFDHTKGPEGDDCCTQVVLATGFVPEIAGCITPGCSELAVKKAKNCAAKAIRDFAAGNRKIVTECGTFNLGKPPTAVPAMQCEDFMSPTDCRIMYNVCDPVMCPASRCDFGGRMPVENVVQSGIIGSIMLCLPNFEDGKGVLIPVCLTGIHAGIDGFTGILKSGRDCLQEQLKSGKTVGICDQIMSIYLCEFFWKQLDPFLKQGIPAITESLIGRGGGEYALFSESWKQSIEAARYFTDFYAIQSVKAFKAKSAAQAGTEICKRYASIAFPTQAKFWQELAKPESPTQATACFQEISMGTATPESHYKVFVYIFAGNDQGVYYSVVLRRPAKPGYYEQFIPEEYFVKDAFGYLPAGQYLSISPDFRAPSGYKEICIRLNDKEICGFADCASTSFAIQEMQNYYLKHQLEQEVSSIKECVSGKPTIMPTLTLNIQSAIEHALEPQLYRRGVVRVCSTNNPGEGVGDKNRWKKIGYCGDKNVGCWLDMNSVNESINDLGIRAKIYNKSEERHLAKLIEEFNLSKPEESQAQLDNIEPKIVALEQEINKFKEEVRKKSLEELQESSVKDWIEKRNKEIDATIVLLIKELKTIKDKCARNDEKARAENNIAKIYDLRARLYAQPELYKIDLTIEKAEKAGTCELQGGRWMEAIACPEGYYEISATDADEHPREKCCKEKIETGKFGRWPLDLPKYNLITSCFGYRTLEGKKDFHDGIDIAAKKGDKVYAVAGGKVIRIKRDCKEEDKKCNDGFGNGVVIKHSDTLFSAYNHLNGVNVNVGQEIMEGQEIGEVGSTGYSTGPHLDFKVYIRESDVWRSNKGEHPLCFFPNEIKRQIQFTSDALRDSKKYENNSEYSKEYAGCMPDVDYCKRFFEKKAPKDVLEKGEKCRQFGYKKCNDFKGQCWWDSSYNECKDCPKKCEGDTKGVGFFELISFWDGKGPSENDLIFKSKNDCEKNNCGLDCLWLNNKCVTKTEEIVKKISPQISNVFLVSRINNGNFELGGKLVNYDDEVDICTVVKIGNDYYSFDNFNLGNINVKKYDGIDLNFKWYNIFAIQKPIYGNGRAYRIAGFEENNKKYWDIIQYRQERINEDGWCIKQRRVNPKEGTYWYRVEVSLNGNTISSLGRPATEYDKETFKKDFKGCGNGSINFDMYEGIWSTLLEPKAYEGCAGISKDVMRISRKSNYDKTICVYNGFNTNNNRCQFLATVEAFKNVPFAYGVYYYMNMNQHHSKNFIAVDCVNLMLSSLSYATGKDLYSILLKRREKRLFEAFIGLNDNIFKQDGVTEVEKWKINTILGSKLPFNNFSARSTLEVGDILFQFDESKDGGLYDNTLILYDDRNKNKILDKDDLIVCVNSDCHQGDLCLLAPNYYTGLFTIVKPTF
ncbi:MAG: peptidoglycan DD-metalloendopeptidase family protein [Candidatus Pacearchaeota archaeon]|nr:peptidoglycan DD-metalloendopeptidase family protein [Candidatus Pacearchaeota archaeon]